MESLRSPFLSSPSSTSPPLSLSSHIHSPFRIHRLSPRRRCCRLALTVRNHSSPKPFPEKPQSKSQPQNLTPLSLVRSSLSLLIFSLSLAFLPFPLHPPPAAIAAPIATAVNTRSKSKSKSGSFDHEFSIYTQRLLAYVSTLLNRIDEVKSGKGDFNRVKEALAMIKVKKKDIQKEILDKLNLELRELRKEESEVANMSEQAMEAVSGARREKERVLRTGNAGTEEVKRLNAAIEEKEREYAEVWDKFEDINDRILRKETMVYSVAIRELGFIERESELLVERFRSRLRRGGDERYSVCRDSICAL